MALVVEDRRKEPCRKTEVAKCGIEKMWIERGPGSPGGHGNEKM